MTIVDDNALGPDELHRCCEKRVICELDSRDPVVDLTDSLLSQPQRRRQALQLARLGRPGRNDRALRGVTISGPQCGLARLCNQRLLTQNFLMELIGNQVHLVFVRHPNPRDACVSSNLAFCLGGFGIPSLVAFSVHHVGIITRDVGPKREAARGRKRNAPGGAGF
jgi:hypothetical protein